MGCVARERHAPAAPYLVSSKNNSDALADEESSCVRVHRAKDAPAESEAVLLDLYVPGSAFAEKSDATVEPVSHGFKTEIGISWRAGIGTARRTRMSFSRHHESALSDS